MSVGKKLRETSAPIRDVPPQEPGAGWQKIVAVGEAPGITENLLGRPFAGKTGGLMRWVMQNVGIDDDAIGIINVFIRKLENNREETTVYRIAEFRRDFADGSGLVEVVRAYCEENGLKRFWVNRLVRTVSQIIIHPLGKGHLQQKYWKDIVRLHHKLMEWKPNVVLALGEPATWALLGEPSPKILGRHAGFVSPSVLVVTRDGVESPIKVVPSYHPGFIIRTYSMSYFSFIHFKFALYQSAFPEIRYRSGEILVPERVDEIDKLWDYVKIYGNRVVCDTETFTDEKTGDWFIRSLGFGFGQGKLAFHIPFYKHHAKENSYWSIHEEKIVVQKLRRFLEDPDIEFGGQNFGYDVIILWHAWRVRLMNYAFDTKHQAYTLRMELPKRLAVLAMIYCPEFQAWKKKEEFKIDG